MFIKFIQYDSQDSNNIWEIKPSKDKIEAFYRKGILTSQIESIENVTFNERDYRSWKIFCPFNDGITHMPDAFPMIFYATRVLELEMIEKIRDSKYVFRRMITK